MKVLKLVLILIFLTWLSGCAFEAKKREVEKKLTDSVNNFHALFNQGKFNQIYEEADDELKNEISNQQFVSYLENVKESKSAELKEVSQVWIDNESSDGKISILFGRGKFFNTATIYTEKNIYIEYFEWKLADDKAKLVSYEIRESSNAGGKVSF